MKQILYASEHRHNSDEFEGGDVDDYKWYFELYLKKLFTNCCQKEINVTNSFPGKRSN